MGSPRTVRALSAEACDKRAELQSAEIQTLKKMLSESRTTFFSQLQACGQQKDAMVRFLRGGATIQERAMHARDPHSGGGLALHAQANVAGRHMVAHQDAGWRGGSVGPHAHGNAARHVVDDLSAEGSGQQKSYNDCHTDHHTNQHNSGVPTTALC